jgi:hypothetical protein
MARRSSSSWEVAGTGSSVDAASAPGTAASLLSVAAAATSFQFGEDLERLLRKPSTDECN